MLVRCSYAEFLLRKCIAHYSHFTPGDNDLKKCETRVAEDTFAQVTSIPSNWCLRWFKK